MATSETAGGSLSSKLLVGDAAGCIQKKMLYFLSRALLDGTLSFKMRAGDAAGFGTKGLLLPKRPASALGKLGGEHEVYVCVCVTYIHTYILDPERHTDHPPGMLHI